MERVRDYEALIRELLAGVAGGWSYGGLVGWLLSRNLKDRDLAQWLREHGATLGVDADVRGQLGCLAGLGRGELAEVAGELVKGEPPQADLFELGKYEEALDIYEQAIEINPSDYEAWCNRGSVVGKLGRLEDANACYERAIEIEPGYYPAWYFQGITLRDLERYEEAISSYERAIEIDPVNYQVWLDRGIVFCDYLKKYEKALESFDRSLNLQPNIALHNRGVALSYLGRGEEALVSYNLAIEFEPDNHYAFNSRSAEFLKLKQYEEALVDCERAIEIYPEFYRVWVNRGFAMGRLYGYQSEINAYYQAFEYIHSDTNYEGWGFLQCQIGRTHYQEGKDQLFSYHKNPHPYYYQALTSYRNALETLTREQFPKLRLETLINTAKVYLAQHNTPAVHQCKTEAFEILQDLLNAQPTFAGKKRLQIEYSSLSQLDVALFIASNDNINALVAAELDKNNRLTWLLSALAETTISPSYAQIQQLLATTEASVQTGIVYWHLSSDNLTTFILTANDSQPLVWKSDRGSQAQQLAKWIKEWDPQYRDYGSKKEVSTQPNQNDEAAAKAREQHPWRQNIPDALTQLRQILEIDRICDQLPATLTHLILIPHGDLHRFPLHALFLASARLANLQGCTYLPSIQIGLNLQKRSIPSKSYTPLLSVEDPQTHQDVMPFAQIESTIVRHLLPLNTHIDSASASLEAVENALSQPYASFHFTGHAAYNSCSPEASALALTDEPLTAKRIARLDLSSYNLITLAACETAITGREKIDTEYVGLTSAFLQAGAANILSTLWQVDEIANAWFTIYFYQQLLADKSPAVALTMTQRWMQRVTWHNLADWLTQFGSLETVADYVKEIFEKEGKLGLDRPTKYSHPYYWAAFTLTGQG